MTARNTCSYLAHNTSHPRRQ